MDFELWLVEVKKIPFYNFLSEGDLEDLYEEYELLGVC